MPELNSIPILLSYEMLKTETYLYFFSNESLQMESDDVGSNLSNYFDPWAHILLQCENIIISVCFTQTL